jgi:alcohol dehydrogenase
MIGAAIGAQVLAIDVNDDAIQLAASLGADKAIMAKGEADIGEAIREITGGGAHVSVDALGITDTFRNSIRGLRKLGRHVQIGMPLGRHAEPTVPLLELVYSRQISIMGTRGIAASRFPALFGMIASQRIDPSQLVTRRIPLSKAGDAIAEMNGYGGVGITVIDRF